MFALLPTIAAPFILFLRRFAADYRTFWLELRILEWVCLVGLVYSLLTGLFRSQPGINKLFRRASTFALVGSVGAAVAEGRYVFRPQIASLTAEAIVLDRAILATVGLLLVSIVAFVFWYPIQLPRNFAMVSSGLAIHVVTQTIQVVFSDALWRAGLRLQEASTIVWITFLTYWVLFLSSRDESTEASE